MEKISYENPEIMKIVRIKNRLNMGNKDILMNIFYREKVLI